MQRTPKSTVPWRGGAQCATGELQVGLWYVRRPVRSNPRLDVLRLPDLPHLEFVVRRRPVRAVHQLPHPLATHSQPDLDLRSSHQVSGHIEQHRHQPTRHLTIGTRLQQDRHVPSATEPRTNGAATNG